MSTVVWLDEAVEDLKKVGVHIAEDDTEAAYRVLIKIKATADSLLLYPEIGRVGRVEGPREVVVNDIPYVLPYQITNKNIRILAVMHTSRK